MQRTCPRGSIPCIAYLTPGDALPVSMSLTFKCDQSSAQASLFLRSHLPVHDGLEPQIITLQYEGSNVMRGVLGAVALPLPPNRLDHLTRTHHPRIQALTLTLKEPCPVWHLNTSCTPFAARRGDESLFDAICGLAKATALCIAFDYRKLQKGKRDMFRRLYEQPGQLASVPLDRNFITRFTAADWSVFDTRGEPHPAVHSNAVTPEPEPLPPYTTAGRKRARPVSPSPAPATPPSKRALLSSCSEHVLASPTEPATTPRSKDPDSLAVATPRPSSPGANALDVEIAVRAVLPGILEALLPTLVVLPQSSLLLSSPGPAKSQPLSRPKLSLLGTQFGTWITQRIATQVDSIYDETAVHIESLYEEAAENAAAEIRDQVESSEMDIRTAKDDAMNELERAADAQRQSYDEYADDVASDLLNTLADQAAEVVDRAQQHFDAILEEKKSKIYQEMGQLGRRLDMLAREMRLLESSQRAHEPPAIDQEFRRARSAPT